MASVRTYILAPNFSYKPSGPIQIGNIIANPLRPTKPLSTLPASANPAIETTTEHDHELAHQTGRTLRAGVWATFLESVGVSADGERGLQHSHTYSVAQLETRYLRDDPCTDAEALARRVAEPAVQAAVQAGVFGRRPVYLITGVKIARGLVVAGEVVRVGGGGVEASAPVLAGTLGVSVGARVAAEGTRVVGSSFRGGEEDVVFAYQLHVIRERRRGGEKRVEVDVFESDAALLHSGEGGQGDGVEVVPLDWQVLRWALDEEGEDGALLDVRKVEDGVVIIEAKLQ